MPVQRRPKGAAEPRADGDSDEAATGAEAASTSPPAKHESASDADFLASLHAEVEAGRRREALHKAHVCEMEAQVLAERERADQVKGRLAAAMAAKLAVEVEVDNLQAQLQAEREELRCAQEALAAAVSESSQRASEEHAAMRRVQADFGAERGRWEEARSGWEVARVAAAKLEVDLEGERQRTARLEMDNARLRAALPDSPPSSLSTPHARSDAARALMTPGLLSPEGPRIHVVSEVLASHSPPPPPSPAASCGAAAAPTADELVARNRQLEEELRVEAEAAEAAEAALHHQRRTSLVQLEELERLRAHVRAAHCIARVTCLRDAGAVTSHR